MIVSLTVQCLCVFGAPAAIKKIPISYMSGDLRITGLMSKPEGSGPFPVVIINHGGFDPASSVGGFMDIFTAFGLVAIASDYRGVAGSAGKHELAAGEVDDVLNAIVYAKTLPSIDSERIVMWGYSHGGAIAFLAAARSPEIKAIATFGAPIEFADCYKYWKENVGTTPSLEKLIACSIYVGGTPEENPDAWKIRSPLYVAGRIACPTLIAQGGKDEAVPARQAVLMAETMKRSGNTNVILLLDPESHHVFDAGTFERIVKPMAAFLLVRAGVGRK